MSSSVHHRHTSNRRRTRIGRIAAAFVALGMGLVMANSAPVVAGIVPTVSLGTAIGYSVLGATTVTNTNPSVLGQSVGLSPGSSIVGFPPGLVLAPGRSKPPTPRRCRPSPI